MITKKFSAILWTILQIVATGHIYGQSNISSFDKVVGYNANISPIQEIVINDNGDIFVAIKEKNIMQDPSFGIIKFNKAGIVKFNKSIWHYFGTNGGFADLAPVDSSSFQITASGYVASGQNVKWETHTIKFNGNLDSLDSDTPRYNIRALDFSPGFTAWESGMSLYSNFDTKVYTWPRDTLLAPFDSISMGNIYSTTLDDSAHFYLHYRGTSKNVSYLQTIQKATRAIQDFRILPSELRKVHATGSGFITAELDSTTPKPTSLILKKRDTAFQVTQQVALQNLLPGKETTLKKGPRQCFTALDHNDGSFYVVYGTYRLNGPKYRGNWAYDLGVLKLDAQFNVLYQKDLPTRSKYYLPQDIAPTPDGGVLLSLGTFAESNTGRLRLVKINANGQIGMNENPLKGQMPLKLYPNPNSSQTFYIDSKAHGRCRFVLYDLTGNLIMEKPIVLNGNDQQVIKIGAPPGAYIFHISNRKKLNEIGKIILK